MPAKIELDGWDALMAQIREAPKEIRDEVRPLVHEHTEGAAEDLRRHYPEASHTAKGTGNLRARVRTVYPTTANSLTGKVLSMAPHAHWYHWKTKKRATRKRGVWNRGIMHEGQHRGSAFIEPLVPIARSRRARLMRGIVQILERRGYTVTGDE